MWRFRWSNKRRIAGFPQESLPDQAGTIPVGRADGRASREGRGPGASVAAQEKDGGLWKRARADPDERGPLRVVPCPPGRGR
jgi:hypothetical protein